MTKKYDWFQHPLGYAKTIKIFEMEIVKFKKENEIRLSSKIDSFNHLLKTINYEDWL